MESGSSITGDNSTARAAEGKAESLPAEEVEALTREAKQFALQGNIPEAIAVLTQAADWFPDFAIINKVLGSLYLQSGDLERAFEHSLKALRAAPNYRSSIIHDYWRILPALHQSIEEQIVAHPPLTVTVEIMNICNLKCRHCYQQQMISGQDRGLMEYERFEKIIERLEAFLPRLHEFSFASVEALLHPRIFEMIHRLRTNRPDVHLPIYTNGMLLNKEAVQNLLDLNITTVIVSLDGCTKAAVESFKTGADFDRIIGNMRQLKQLAGERIALNTNFVLHRENVGQLSDYVSLCSSIGISSIHLSGFIPFTGEDAARCCYSEAGLPDVEEQVEAAREKAEQLGLQLVFLGTKFSHSCFSWKTMYIDIQGNIVPCNQLAKGLPLILLDRAAKHEPISWGNILAEDPHGIWTKPESLAFRRTLFLNQLPAQCSCCAIGHGVIC